MKNKITRRDFLKRTGAGTASAAMLLALAGCGSSSSEDVSSTSSDSTDTSNADTTTSSEGVVADDTGNVLEGEQATEMVDKVVVVNTSSSFSLAPFGSASGARDLMVKRLYSALMCPTVMGASLENGECQPAIAKNVTKVDDLTYDVEIFDYVHDSEGNPITVDDVIWSLQKCYEESEVTAIGNYMESAEKVDDYNMTIHLKFSGAGVIESILTTERITIVSKEWYENASEDERLYSPACTGPYKIQSYEVGGTVVMEAVEDFWQTDEAYINDEYYQNVKIIEYPCIAEAAMRTVALENGEVDITSIQASEIYRFYDVDAGQVLDGWNASLLGNSMFTCILCNMDSGMSPVADDLNLRMAIMTAISTVDCYLALGYSASLVYLPHALAVTTAGGYNADWDSQDYYEYDMDKALEYMKASDYADGCTLRLLCRTGSEAMFSVIMAELESIGITVDLLCYDQALFNQYKFDSTAWDLIIDTKGGSIVAAGWYDMFAAEGYTNGGVNFWKDETFYELIDNAMFNNTTEDLNACNEYMYENAIGKTLMATKTAYISQPGILGIAMNGSCHMNPGKFTYAADYVSNGD